MANSIWLFMHMLDLADWDTGIIADWRDEAEAEEMGMELRTLREQRRELNALHYITCTQKQYGQSIVIHNWTNPREYTGEIYNKKQGYKKTSPQEPEVQGYAQGYTQGSIKNVTPTSLPKNQIPYEEEEEGAQPKKSNVFSAYEKEIGALTPMVADAIRDAEKEYPEDWIIEALQIAVERNARNWRFVLAILVDCKAKNVRPSLKKLESTHANKTGNSKIAGSRQPKANAGEYTDADRAAAELINKSVAVR